MSGIKLYIITIAQNGAVSAKSFRDFEVVKNEVLDTKYEGSLSILHSGFVRPKLPEKFPLEKHFIGKVLYSASIKWALPQSYQSTTIPVLKICSGPFELPCYLAINNWGYNVTEDDIGIFYEAENENASDINEVSTHTLTIVQAAEKVLRDSRKSLNKEEIYALIVEHDLYKFNTPKPVSVLNVQLNRFTRGTSYSKASTDPIFGKTSEGSYFLLSEKSEDPVGWVKALQVQNSDVYKLALDNAICSETDFEQARNSTPESVLLRIELERFRILLEETDITSPIDVVKILPMRVLEQPINSLGLTVRSYNVLHGNGVDYVRDLGKFTRWELARLPSMGKKSLADISNSLIKKVSAISGLSVSEMGEEQSGSRKASSIENETNHNGRVSVFATDSTPLVEHLNRTLENLSEVDRLIMHGRLGFRGRVLTLEEVGQQLDVTRERVRQRQSKYAKRIIEQEDWDDEIGRKIGQLLINRDEPLMLELLEIEDDWFAGFGENYLYLANVIELFSENELRVIDANGLKVITRITQKSWDLLIKGLRQDLRKKASEGRWNRSDIEQHILSLLAENSAQELLSVVHSIFHDYLQYDGDSEESILIAYGKSAESAIAAVLAQAEKPLHYTEIAKRASDILGKEVDERRAQNALMNDGAWLYDRGTYGLKDHCPLSEKKRELVRTVAEKLLYQGPINRQWHSREIINQIQLASKIDCSELDPYVLRMCLESSEKLVFLNRMVWARSDSGMDSGDRIETAELIIKILEDAGEPLSGSELISRLSKVRGVSDHMQIHASDRIVAVAPNVWGLSEWDNKRNKHV